MWNDVRAALRKREVLLPLVLCIVLPLWGLHGRAPFDWAALVPALDTAYDRALADFAWGVLLAAVVPALVVKLALREPLADYGIALGDTRAGLAWTAALLAASVPAMWLASRDPAMRALYPLFGPGRVSISTTDLVVYELAYLGFFVAVEASIRGWLLFSIAPVSAPLAVVVSALVQVVWHLGKPTGEIVGALVWGIGIAALNLRLRSIVWATLVHWLMNVLLDVLITLGA